MYVVLIVALVLGGLGVGGYFLYKKLTEKETSSEKNEEKKEEIKGKKIK